MSDDTPVFRAVTSGGARRGLRLERVYWDALNDIANETGQDIGAMVDALSQTVRENGSLSSTIRSFVTSHYFRAHKKQKAASIAERLTTIVEASNTPGLILTRQKTIAGYNQAFIQYLKIHFSHFDPGRVLKSLTLNFDLDVIRIFEALEKQPTQLATTSFVLGFEKKRIRGKANFVLAPDIADRYTLVFIQTESFR